MYLKLIIAEKTTFYAPKMKRSRGLSVINSMAAYEAGADRLHGAGIGIGERTGNTPMDTLLVNMRLAGYIDQDLTGLMHYAQTVSDATGVPIPTNYPVVGSDAFETATGVHAAAIAKAIRLGDDALVDDIYSGVPAHWFGLKQVIRVGPMSGKWNAHFWLRQHGHEPTEDRMQALFDLGKAADHTLTDDEIIIGLGDLL